MDKELVKAIAKLLSIPKDELNPKLDEIERDAGFLVAGNVRAVRNFINHVWLTIPSKGVSAVMEVVDLIEKGSGPVVHDPADHG